STWQGGTMSSATAPSRKRRRWPVVLVVLVLVLAALVVVAEFVPGAFSSPASVGCHRLVAEGRAQIVVGPDDPVDAVVGPCGRSVRGRSTRRGGALRSDEPLGGGRQDPEVVRVVDALGRRALGEQEIAVRSGMSIGAVADALALAELQGLVRHTGGGWARS
ncbi:hypothetical protein D8M35_13280, partial [Curtobacterium sp. HSID17257]